MYLSSIQQGIQAAHAQMELFIKYSRVYQPDEFGYIQNVKLFDWAENYKTMICLDAGHNKELNDIEEFLSNTENPYPWATFRESSEALGGILTNIAIILPEEIYGEFVDVDADVYKSELGWRSRYSKFEQELIRMKNKYRLAK